MNTADEPGEPMLILSEEYDRESDEPVFARIVRLVAVAANRDAMDLDPLGQVIDADALDTLINSRSISDLDTEIEVSFEYEGYVIEIAADGAVSLLVEAE